MEEKIIPNFLQAALKKAVEDEFDKAEKMAIESLKQRKAEIVSSILILLYKQVEVNKIGDKLTIEIRMSEGK